MPPKQDNIFYVLTYNMKRRKSLDEELQWQFLIGMFMFLRVVENLNDPNDLLTYSVILSVIYMSFICAIKH